MNANEEQAYRLGQASRHDEDELQEAYEAGYQDGLNANPWRYPSRGEFPEKLRRVVVTWTTGGQDIVYAGFVLTNPKIVRAWKQLDRDAPELEASDEK